MKNNLTFSPKKQLILALLLIGAAYPSVAQNPVLAYNNTTPVEKTAGVGEKKNLKVSVSSEAENPLLFRVTIANPTKERITMFIKDGNNNILHREVLEADPQITGRYNLQSLEDGAYYFEFRNGKNRIEKVVDIKTEVYSNRVVAID
ncbi:hypothetical protein [uncultured Chitinophaga sp.]|uniref:hypothetical protein n=1 Tax=uncultured Chitinophaga sp. TaxID=339340 RepID=UPI0025DAFA8D|nr:hypothetical protein [uncultured Chitinophaga sp.]